MPTHIMQSGESFGLLCWEYNAPASLLLNHANNRALKTTLQSRARAAGSGHSVAALSAQVRDGDAVFMPGNLYQSLSIPPGNSVAHLRRTRRGYLEMAFQRAFGSNIASTSWDPSRGFRANRRRMLQIYDYYAATYNRAPDQFLWAGLGKLAGATVISSLDNLVLTVGDTPDLAHKLVHIAKEIFYDIAWLHEAAADNQRTAWLLATMHDARRHRVRSDGSTIPTRYATALRSGVRVADSRYAYGFGSYARALQHIFSSDSTARQYGNLGVFANEQWVNIQPWYDDIRSGGLASHIFSAGSGMVRSVHPYHRDFVVDVRGNVGIARDRWRWINDVPNAMWPQWIGLPQSERTRLVGLPMTDLMQRRWGPIMAQRQHPGTQY